MSNATQFTNYNYSYLIIYFYLIRQSNLADIFDVDDSVNSTEANPTLKYIPPKPKQLREQKTVDKSIWNVVIAKIVRAFKLYVYFMCKKCNVLMCICCNLHYFSSEMLIQIQQNH